MSVKNTQFNTKDSYNSQYVSGKYVGYNSQQLSDATPSAPQVNSATGGVIAEYTSGSDVYRSHTFLASGSLVVSQLSDDPTVPHEADILVVGGGGAGGHGQPGSYETGGGGAGGGGGKRARDGGGERRLCKGKSARRVRAPSVVEVESGPR